MNRNAKTPSADDRRARATRERGQAASDRLAASNQRLLDAVFQMLGAEQALQEEGVGTARSDDLQPWVLCVDDDSDFARMLKLRLEALGIAVKSVAEGLAGLRSAAREQANAILLDYQLPNGQGDYVLRRLKANPATRDIPVIVITGRKERGLARRMLALGAASFMTKPLDMTALTQELGKHLRERPQHRRARPPERAAAVNDSLEDLK